MIMCMTQMGVSVFLFQILLFGGVIISVCIYYGKYFLFIQYIVWFGAA
jgi:hypothetical protein